METHSAAKQSFVLLQGGTQKQRLVLRAGVERLDETAMHACRAKCMRACVRFVCVCYVRKWEGQDQKQQPFILIRPGQPRLHTRLKLYMEIHMLRSRSEQEVETDGVTEEYE